MMTTTAVIDMVSSCLSSFHTGRHSVEWELYFVCGVMCPSVAFHWAKHVFVGELINKLICGPPTPTTFRAVRTVARFTQVL